MSYGGGGEITNNLTVSASTVRLFERCQRAWWIRRSLAWGGWRRNADIRSRLAYGLSKAKTWRAVAGAAVHEEIALACQDRQRSLQTARSALIGRMNTAAADSSSGHWAREPKRFVNVVEDYYREGDQRQRLDLAKEHAVRCLEAWWAAHREPTLALDIIGIERTAAWMLLDLPCYAVPDIAARSQAYGVELIDWKTGREHIQEDAFQATLLLLFAHTVLGATEATARFVYLSDGTENQLHLGDVGAHALLEDVRAHVDGIRQFLDDPKLCHGVEANFPPADDWQVCRYCEYWHPCRGTRERTSDGVGTLWQR